MNPKTILLVGTILAGFSVAIGAFGAHGLKDLLAANGRAETFETAVKYQFYHALGLLMLGVLAMQKPQIWFEYSAWGLFIGTLIFSGSLYVLCLTGIKWLGAITPIGGVLMIAGWSMAAFAITKISF